MAMAADRSPQAPLRMDELNLAILRFIAEYTREQGFSPSVREMIDALPPGRWSSMPLSTATVHYRLRWLERNGWITWPTRAGARVAGAIRVRNLRKAEAEYEAQVEEDEADDTPT